MITGIGVDTAMISRIEKSLENPHFRQRVFALQEQAVLETYRRPAPHAAALWAAKEALGKALGEGLSAFELTEAAVQHDENGAPFFVFSGALGERMASAGLTAHLSLTHEGDYATAFVVLERQN